MSTPAQIPFVSPDGTPGYVDAHAAQQAASAGYKPALAMRAKDGTKGLVAFSDLKDAMANGYQTEGQFQQAHIPSDAPKGFAQSLVAPIPNMARSLYHAVTDQATPEESQAITNLHGTADVIGRTMYRTLIKPSISAENTAEASVKAGHPLQALSEAAEGIPLIGGGVTAGKDAIAQYLSGDKSGAAGSVIGNLLTGGMAAGGAGEIASRLGMPSTVAGQNYAPSHGAAFEGVMAKATGMGPNFIPQNLTSEALSPIRQSAADMLANGSPTEQAIARNATARGIKPLDRLGAVHSVIQKSLSDLEAQHAPALAQVGSTPVDMRRIQAQLRAQIRPGMSAADISGINDLIDRSGQINTIGDLNGFRQIMNEESSPSYRQTPTRAGQASAPQQVATDTANAVRNHYYDQLQKATGIDFQPLKATQSRLLTTKEAIERIQSPEAKAEATFHAGGKSVKEIAGDLANVIKEPRTTITQTLLRESPATRTANLIRKSLQSLPDASRPVSPFGSPIASGVPQIPANASPASVTATTVPNTPPSAPAPMLANPQSQLPSIVQRLLAGGGQSLELPADTSGMSVSQGPTSSYPALNESTARTRVRPTQFQEAQPIVSSGARPVTPTGQVLSPIQRFLQAGDLEPTTTNPSIDDLKRAIQGMRKKRGK